MKYRSENIECLLGSLSLAQGDYKTVIPNQNSSSGPYANLGAVLDAVRDSLKANGLSIFHQTELTPEGNMLWTVLGHQSGQYTATCTKIVQGKNFRDTYNGIESFKRLSASNLLGIALSHNDPLFVDDHGQEEFDHQVIQQAKKNERPMVSNFSDTVNKDQYADLLFELEGRVELTEQILETYKISTLADLPKSEYHMALARIRRIKKTYDDYVIKKTR